MKATWRPVARPTTSSTGQPGIHSIGDKKIITSSLSFMHMDNVSRSVGTGRGLGRNLNPAIIQHPRVRRPQNRTARRILSHNPAASVRPAGITHKQEPDAFRKPRIPTTLAISFAFKMQAKNGILSPHTKLWSFAKRIRVTKKTSRTGRHHPCFSMQDDLTYLSSLNVFYFRYM